MIQDPAVDPAEEAAVAVAVAVAVVAEDVVVVAEGVVAKKTCNYEKNNISFSIGSDKSDLAC